MSKRSAIVAFTTIILLMSAAAAQSLAGTNTVFSDDIVDGQVKHIDIKENTIGSSRMLDNSVHSVKISDGSIVAGDMADGAVTGPKIDAGAVDGSKIGPGAVDGSKVQDGSLAIGSDVSSTRNTAVRDFGLIPAGACVSTQLYSVIGSSAADDAVTVTPDQTSWPNALIATTQADAAGPISAVSLIVCNIGGAVDPPATVFNYSVMP